MNIRAALFWALLAGGAGPQDAEVEKLKSEVESMRDPVVAWRSIKWKSCLLDGLHESREKGKPLLCWVFIDRPADDERC